MAKMPKMPKQPSGSTHTAIPTRKRSAGATPLSAVELPKPKPSAGKSLPEALRRRRTVREIGDRPLSRQLLSNLLWAACGVNRRNGPFGALGLTAASASNSQEIDVYVALAEGVFLFEPSGHRLIPVVAGDLRALAIGPGQKVAMRAPVQLVYVADVHRLTHTAGFEEPGLHDPEVQKSYYFVDTGLIAGNVYLFAASQGLACWFHNCDRIGLAAKLGLRAEQRLSFAQSVGWAERPRGRSNAVP
jgi:nitroreductase